MQQARKTLPVLQLRTLRSHRLRRSHRVACWWNRPGAIATRRASRPVSDIVSRQPGRAGRSVEGPGAALRSVSPGAGEAADSGDRCYRSEAVWLHLGDRSGGAVKGALSAEACPVRPGRVEGQGHPYPALAAFKARLDCDAGVQRALREETVEPMRAEV